MVEAMIQYLSKIVIANKLSIYRRDVINKYYLKN